MKESMIGQKKDQLSKECHVIPLQVNTMTSTDQSVKEIESMAVACSTRIKDWKDMEVDLSLSRLIQVQIPGA